MARTRQNSLPKYVELNAHNRTYYYKNPPMPGKARLGKDEKEAIRFASSLNARYRIQCEQEAVRLETVINVGGECFSNEFGAFIEKYISDYGLKSSTARLLRQRHRRLTEALGKVQVPMIDTQMLREASRLASIPRISRIRSTTYLSTHSLTSVARESRSISSTPSMRSLLNGCDG